MEKMTPEQIELLCKLLHMDKYHEEFISVCSQCPLDIDERCLVDTIVFNAYCPSVKHIKELFSSKQTKLGNLLN